MKLITLNTSGKLRIYKVSTETKISLPLIEGGISAGFPSPAADFMDSSIDLNEYLIKHQSTTHTAKVDGMPMIEAGINDKDLLIIDKALEPTDGKIAVCVIDGEFTLKQLKVVPTGIEPISKV